MDRLTRQLATRIAVVGSAAWFGAMIIASQLARDFRWFPNAYRNNYDFGPAGITAFVGIAVIFAVCLGAVWIREAGGPPKRP